MLSYAFQLQIYSNIFIVAINGIYASMHLFECNMHKKIRSFHQEDLIKRRYHHPKCQFQVRQASSNFWNQGIEQGRRILYTFEVQMIASKINSMV